METRPINVVELDRRFEDGDQVDAASLVAAGLLRRETARFKVLAGGEIGSALHVRVERISAAAEAKIVAAGGSVEVINAENADSGGADEA